MLVRDGRFLVERRKPTKSTDPGAVALPGGRLESDESVEAALRRLHFFAVTSWQQEPVPNEAESLHWIPLDAPERLDLEVDRIALGQLRLLRAAGAPAR